LPCGQKQITHADGTEMTLFTDGQTLRKHRDGRKEVVLPCGQKQITHADGTKLTIFADDERDRDDGTSTKEVTAFPDGRKKTLWTNGNIDVTHPDGRKETVLPSGEKKTSFPDGTTEIVTAKGLHIPAILEPSQRPCSSDYHDCDSRAQEAQRGRHWRSVEQLAEHLAAPFLGDAEKMARVMFRWITANVAYDVQRLRQEKTCARLARGDSQTPETVMRTGLAVCEGYSKLLCSMCDAVGVPCKYIGGDGRGGEDDREPEGHGWNALSFDGSRTWHLCDVCWASGSCKSGGSGATLGRQNSTDTLARASSGGFTRRFANKWWCTAPEHFIERHLPQDRCDQLLERPISISEWTKTRDTAWTPDTFTSMNDGDEVLAPSHGVIRRGQRVEFRIFLAEESASTLRLCWNSSWGDEATETLRSTISLGGHTHSLVAQARSFGQVTICKRGPTKTTSTGTTTSYYDLAKWKVE
jgi:hypothetical protein